MHTDKSRLAGRYRLYMNIYHYCLVGVVMTEDMHAYTTAVRRDGLLYGPGAIVTSCEPVWPNGKPLGWQAEGPRFDSASALLSLQKLWSVDSLVTFSLTIDDLRKSRGQHSVSDYRHGLYICIQVPACGCSAE